MEHRTYFVEVVDGAGIPSAGHAILPDGGQDHALADALLEAAVLAPIALRLGDLAVALGHARVHPLVLNCSLEETLAPATIRQYLPLVTVFDLKSMLNTTKKSIINQ